MSNIKALRQRVAEARKTLRALLDKAKAESRDLSEPEAAEYEATMAKVRGIEASLKREEEVAELERGMDPANDENEAAANAAGAPGQKVGFENLGQFLRAVVMHERTKGRVSDPRLHYSAAAGASEAVPSDGGFLVQKDFSSELLTRIYETGQIVQRVAKLPISANSNGIKINAVDEDSRADGSRWGGVLAYWVNEAQAATASKPKFRQIELQLEKLIAVCYSTDELLEDAVALQSVISRAFSEEMMFKLEDSIINGTGAGQPLGILSSSATIQAAKDAGDSGATISTNDVLAMWERLWSRSRSNAVWFIDQSVEKNLYPLTLGSGSLGQILLFTPPAAGGNGYGSMMGRPVIPHEHGAVLGTPGDIILADLSQYLLIDKGAPKQDYSMHVNFLTDEGVFRFTYRVDGEPAWKKPLTPKSGGPTQSTFVTLQTRS